MLAHILYGGTVVLGDVAVGTHILKQIVHGRLGQVDAVAGNHIPTLGVTSGGILEYLGTVEELPTLFLAHLHQGFVVLIHLALGQVLGLFYLFPLLQMFELSDFLLNLLYRLYKFHFQ